MDDSGAAPRLLVLDDVEAVGTTIAAFARSVGFDAKAVTEPSAFFEALTSWSPDVLVIDLVMPAMDGVEVIRRLSQSGCNARLVISSGVGSRVLDAARRAAGEQGLPIIGVLSKPFRAQDAKALFRTALQAAPTPMSRADANALAPVTDADVQAAFERREFRLVYQPKVQTRTGQLEGFEALMRWRHPQRGPVSPDQFIPVAERIGLIQPMTRWVLESAIDWLGREFPAGDIGLAVNVSAAHWDGDALLRHATALCRERQVAPSRLTFELTETATMHGVDNALALFTQLRTLGFALAIDDFGTGYSSMVQLVRMPFSEVKIDRSFVMTALKNAESHAVVSCIAALAQRLGLGMVAEGVEDLAMVGVLDGMGCQSLQGFAISRPLEAGEVGSWARDWSRRRRTEPWP